MLRRERQYDSKAETEYWSLGFQSQGVKGKHVGEDTGYDSGAAVTGFCDARRRVFGAGIVELYSGCFLKKCSLSKTLGEKI